VDGIRFNGCWRRSKKIIGLGDSSLHWQIAIIAVETGISPRELLSLEPRMLWTMMRYMVTRSEKSSGRR